MEKTPLKIAAIVVTYNRCELLQKVIAGLRNQDRPIDNIVVINNDSSDGTSVWLSKQPDITVINQTNLGSSGGQYSGAKYAYENQFDFIWLMDDDVVAESNCLSELLKHIDKYDIVCPLRFNHDGVYLNDVKKLNLTHPFSGIWQEIINEQDIKKDIIPIEGFTFEGPLINRKVIDTVGLPEKNFFIYADDTEFSVRVLKNNYKAAIATKAKFFRQIPPVADKAGFTWKHFYIIRNLIAIDRNHTSFLVRNIRPFGYLFSWLKVARSAENIKTVLSAFLKGIMYKVQDK